MSIRTVRLDKTTQDLGKPSVGTWTAASNRTYGQGKVHD